MTLPQRDISRLQSEMRAAVREHWKAFLFEGILLAILGLAAIIVPQLASLAITIFLGWIFLIAAIGGLIITFWARQMPGFWWSLISAALAVLAASSCWRARCRASSPSPSWSAPTFSPRGLQPSCMRLSTGANCPVGGRGYWWRV